MTTARRLPTGPSRAPRATAVRTVAVVPVLCSVMRSATPSGVTLVGVSTPPGFRAAPAPATGPKEDPVT
jgi:hypothetical protein